MTKTIRVFAWILLSLILIFLSLGYASLADEIFVNGEANIEGKPYEGVYITNVELYSEKGATDVSHSFTKPTNILVTGSGRGSVTYKVTVHNNTNVTYWYVGQDYFADFEANSLLEQKNGISVVTKDHPNDTSPTFNSNDWVPPQTFRDFYVTYTYGSASGAYPVTFINFMFGIKMDAVHDKFLAVLNDSSPGGGYEYLSEVFNKKYAATGETVIASVGDEKEIFNTLFGSDLSIKVDGVDVPVTVMIRRENVDNRATGDDFTGSGAPSGCEYTVYITVDPLNSTTGKAEVYAVSYSNGGVAFNDDRWYQLGQLYEGTANKIDYDKATSGVQGAFDVYSWIASPAKYEVAQGITYLVGQEQGDQYDKLKTLEQIMATNDQDIFNDIDNSRIFKTVWDIINNPANSSKDGLLGLREAFLSAAPFYNVYNGGQEIKVKRECTRAEIIPYILNIQTALYYYNEVN